MSYENWSRRNHNWTSSSRRPKVLRMEHRPPAANSYRHKVNTIFFVTPFVGVSLKDFFFLFVQRAYACFVRYSEKGFQIRLRHSKFFKGKLSLQPVFF